MPGGALHQNLFVPATDGNLYNNYWDGSAWNWVSLGIPAPGVNVNGAPAAINYQMPDGTVHENVFVVGSDGNLYNNYWDGSGWTWASLGKPIG